VKQGGKSGGAGAGMGLAAGMGAGFAADEQHEHELNPAPSSVSSCLVAGSDPIYEALICTSFIRPPAPALIVT
jgi:hypothetical protein